VTSDTGFTFLNLFLDDNQSSKEQTSSASCEVIELIDIRKEYALSLAKLLLVEKYKEFETSSSLPDPHDAVLLYIQDGLIDNALSLGLLFDQDLTIVFGEFSVQCVESLRSLNRYIFVIYFVE
jgi:hypothetical protein